MALKKHYSQVKKRLYLEGGFSFANYTLLHGIFLIGFAIAMGADNFQLGILVAIPLLANMIQIFSPFILEVTGTKKYTSIISLLAGRLLWIGMILLAFGVIHTGSNIGFMMTMLLASSIFVAVGNLSLLSWMKDIVPVRKLARFWGKRNIYATFGGIAAYLSGSYLIDKYSQTDIYGYIFMAALAAGFIAVLHLIRIPEKKTGIKAIKPGKLARRMAEPFKDMNFRPLLYFSMAWGFAINIASPFFLVYMIDDLSLSFVAISLFILVDSISRMAGLNAWRGLADRYGAKSILVISATVTSCIPLMFLFINKGNYLFILPILVASAFAYAGVDIAVGQILFKSAPRKHDAYYLSTFTAVTGLVSALGPVIGGYLAVLIKNQGSFAIMEILPPLKYIFAISFMLRVFCIPLIYSIYEPKARDVNDVLNRMRTLRSVSFFVNIYNFADYASRLVLFPQKQFFILQRKTIDLARKDIPPILNNISKIAAALEANILHPKKISIMKENLDKAVSQLEYAKGSRIHEVSSEISSSLETLESDVKEGAGQQTKKKVHAVRKNVKAAHERLKKIYKKEME